MKLKQPFGRAYKNLLITTDNEVWAYFTCPGEYVIGQNKEKQEKHKRNWNQFLQSLRRFEDFELFLNPNSYDLEDRLKAFSDSFDSQAKETGEDVITRTLENLESHLSVLTTEKFYIGVKLSGLSSASSIKGRVGEWTNQVVGKLLAFNHYQLEVDDSFLKQYKLLEAEAFQLVGAVNGRRLVEKEVIQSFRYHYVRGMKTSFSNDFSEKNRYSLTDSILDP